MCARLRRQLTVGFFRKTALVLGTENFSGHAASGFDDETSDLALKLSQHAGVFGGGGFARFDNDLFGSSDGFLSFLFLDTSGSGADFFDQLVGMGISLRYDFMSLRF